MANPDTPGSGLDWVPVSATVDLEVLAVTWSRCCIQCESKCCATLVWMLSITSTSRVWMLGNAWAMSEWRVLQLASCVAQSCLQCNLCFIMKSCGLWTEGSAFHRVGNETSMGTWKPEWGNIGKSNSAASCLACASAKGVLVSAKSIRAWCCGPTKVGEAWGCQQFSPTSPCWARVCAKAWLSSVNWFLTAVPFHLRLETGHTCGISGRVVLKSPAIKSLFLLGSVAIRSSNAFQVCSLMLFCSPFTLLPAWAW